MDTDVGVSGIDHVALPTDDAERLLAFYTSLGFGAVDVDEWRAGRVPTFSLVCGPNRISVHPENLAPHRGEAWYLRGRAAEVGGGDVCFVWSGDMASLLGRLGSLGIEPIKGPVSRVGGQGAGTSVYLRDPDGNLVELMSYEG